jgi:hypothetical protein
VIRDWLWKLGKFGFGGGIALLLSAGIGWAGDNDSPPFVEPGSQQIEERGDRLSDLGLFNFFSAGWDEGETVKRERATGTPDLALLRVQTNFMEREFRLNYFFENNIRSKTRENLDNLDFFIAWAFNRRLMIEVFGNYQWVDVRGKGSDISGGFPEFVGRVQLIDIESSSYTFNFRVLAPDKGIGERQTTLSYGFAGFEDLAYWLGLDRVGLYTSVLFDTLAGPRERGARQNNVAYDISIAKTLTSRDTPIFGTFTPFVEFFAQTDLDGDHAGRTNFTITPAVRFNLGKVEGIALGRDNWLLWGVDIPVVGPHPWDAIYRFTYIKNF